MVLFDQRSALVERGYRIHTRLARLTADGAGLSGLVQAMAEISGRGVLVQDKRGQVLAEHASPTLAGIWGDILLELSPFKQLPEHFQDRKLAGKQNLPVMQAMAGGLARLVTPINVGGVARGYLSLVGWPGEFDVSNGNIDREPLGRTDHRFDELDHLVAEQGAVICAIEMSRSKALRETEKRLQTDLLNALLQSEFSPRDASLWAGSMGLDLLALHMAVRFAWLKPDSPSRRRLETLVHGELTRQGLHSIAAPLGAELICFIECTMQSGQATGTMDKTVDRSEIKTALSFANSVLKQAIAEFPTRPVICGVGAPVQDLSEWQRSFRQAGQALEMARRLEAVEPLYFPDLSIYRLLFQIEHNPELLAFQEEMLGALLAQDNSRELLNTLETYFKHNGNISQTAEALFIHRNTLTYRLERISTLLSQDADKVNPFENPDTRLALQLALYIFRMGNSRRA